MGSLPAGSEDVVADAAEEARLLAPGEGRVDVAHEIQTLGAIAVLDREAAAVEGDADAAPGAVEAVVDLQRRRRPALDEARTRRRAGRSAEADEQVIWEEGATAARELSRGRSVMPGPSGMWKSKSD